MEEGQTMQVTETLNTGLKRGYSITVSAGELDAKVQEKLREAQPEIAMKGFRKGKVPMALLRKQYGPRLLGEAMQETIDGALSSHMESSGDRPAAQPEVKMTNPAWKEGDDVEVTVSYERLPDVPAVDFSQVALTRLTVKAEAAAVEEALANLAGTAKNFEDRRRAPRPRTAIRSSSTFSARSMASRSRVVLPVIIRWFWVPIPSSPASRPVWSA